MKEILFEWNDGLIVGLSIVGWVFVGWSILTSGITAGIVYSLSRSGEIYDDPMGNFVASLLIAALISVVIIVLVFYWKVALFILGVALVFALPSAAAYWLGSRS